MLQWNMIFKKGEAYEQLTEPEQAVTHNLKRGDVNA